MEEKREYQYPDKPTNRDRNKVIEQLKANYAVENLDIEDFEERIGLAHNTESKSALMALIRDLPFVAPENASDIDMDSHTTQKTNSASESYSETQYGINPKPQSSKTFFSFFSGTTKKGVWKAPRQLNAVAIFGGTDIDLRKAKIPAEGIKIDAVAIFGGCDIIVPPGIPVETNGIGIFGGFDSNASEEDIPGKPKIIINGVALFGGVDVKQKT